MVREKGEGGRHVYLNVALDQARIEDLLRLGVHTDPPVLEGQVKLHARVDGVYSLDGARFNFTGTADMQATVSRMVGGWKGLLLMPVDKYFQKNGAGTEVPFKIDGTKSDPHFGLDFGRKQPR